MNRSSLAPGFVLAAIALEACVVAQVTRHFLTHATKQRIVMTDLLYVLTSIGFFALMLAFVWACEKV